MKKDKKLQEYAEERLSALGNEEFLNKLRERVPERQKTSVTKRPRIGALAGTLAAAAVVAITVLCIVFADIKDSAHGGSNDFLYTVSKADFENSTLTELNKETKIVELFVRGADSRDVTRYFDTETDETKFYIVNTASEIIDEMATVCVVVNGYEYGGAIPSGAMTNAIEFENFAVKYSYTYYPFREDYMYQYQGIIDTGEEKIYIWYNACQEFEYDGFYAFAATMFG